MWGFITSLLQGDTWADGASRHSLHPAVWATPRWHIFLIHFYQLTPIYWAAPRWHFFVINFHNFFLLFYTNFLSRATVTYFSPFFSLIHTYFFFVFSPISHSFTPIYWATPQWHIFIINFLTHLHQFSEPLHGHIFFSYLFTICLNYVHQFSFQSVSIFSVRDAQFALWEMYNFLLKKYTIFASPGFLEIDPPPYQGPAPLPTVPLAVEQFTQVLIRMIVVLMRKLWIPTRKK